MEPKIPSPVRFELSLGKWKRSCINACVAYQLLRATESLVCMGLHCVYKAMLQISSMQRSAAQESNIKQTEKL